MEKGQVSITVGMDTDKLQQKLRAIAKHTEALANELDEIDKAGRPEDEEIIDKTTINADDKAWIWQPFVQREE